MSKRLVAVLVSALFLSLNSFSAEPFVSEKILATEIQVFIKTPSPQVTVAIQIPNKVTGEISCSISNLLGQNLYSGLAVVGETLIPMAELPSGVYFLSLQFQDGQRIVKKFDR